MPATSDPALPPADVAAAVRAILGEEVDRVHHPGPRADDRDGWHPVPDPDPSAPGRPVFDPETWRYFQLRDVAVIDGLVAVAFTWTEPSTPPLTYLVLTHPRPGAPETAARSARGHLRVLLAPGWRSRVERHWLDRDRVLISRGRRTRSRSVDDAIAAALEQRWHTAADDD